MIVPAPETIKNKIGNEVAEAFGRWFEDILESNAVSRDEFRPILTRLEVLERQVFEIKQDMKDFRREVNERFDAMNNSINERFDLINDRFDRMNDRFDRINDRFDRIYERIGTMMKWMVGVVGLFGTLITILLAIGQFVK